jgi:hypothetical protein
MPVVVYDGLTGFRISQAVAGAQALKLKFSKARGFHYLNHFPAKIAPTSLPSHSRCLLTSIRTAPVTIYPTGMNDPTHPHAGW